MPYTNPIARPIPDPTQKRNTQETRQRVYDTYWQNDLLAFHNYRNRFNGGQGFDSNEIAPSAIKNEHLSLTSGKEQRITSWTGNNIDLLANQIYILYTFQVLNPKVNSEIDIWLKFYFGVYGEKNCNIWLERSTTSFAQTSGLLTNPPTTNLVPIGVFNQYYTTTLRSGTNMQFTLPTRDWETKPAGILYYRLTIQANGTDLRIYNGAASDTSATYRVY